MDLKVWMKENRWTNTAMAKEIGVTQASISRVATKAGMPSLMLAKNIVRFTNKEVSLADLGLEEK